MSASLLVLEFSVKCGNRRLVNMFSRFLSDVLLKLTQVTNFPRKVTAKGESQLGHEDTRNFFYYNSTSEFVRSVWV